MSQTATVPAAALAKNRAQGVVATTMMRDERGQWRLAAFIRTPTGIVRVFR